MKKIQFVLLVFFAVTLLAAGCSSETSSGSNLSMDNLIQAFTSNGAELHDDKPFFEMIGAKDGVMFYLDLSPVKVYEYESEEALKKAKSENTLLAEWISNGRFLLETKKDEAKEIFTNVK